MQPSISGSVIWRFALFYDSLWVHLGFLHRLTYACLNGFGRTSTSGRLAPGSPDSPADVCSIPLEHTGGRVSGLGLMRS
ncbi:hypothetical protein B0H67DRAFT_563143 [Lasiosphaeris hirsuta]|uniref:Uncharacterized protein n=1 Tax=Lasiosphaeris hirsuta TaxID=260670 RepID=A0AA40BAZ4_9PEZI|nr:hypothetical protein B0H67DRAFT_563143 [Lasiosphaeris hirsuta]